MTTEFQPLLTVTQEIPIGRVADLLCSAFESGYSPWCEIKRFVKPAHYDWYRTGDTFTDLETRAKIFPHIDYPLNGGALILVSVEDDTLEVDGKTQSEWTLDLPAIRRGLQLMSTVVPNQFAAFLAENDDGITADCFLQLAVFGELIYA